MKRSLAPFLSVAAAAALGSSARAVPFVTPSFFGQPNTTYQEWQGFTSPAGPNPATTKANTGTPNWFDRTAATDGAFDIGVAPSARIYSFSGTINPQIDVPTPSLGQAGLTQIVLQTEVSGSPLDTTLFRAQAAGGASLSPASIVVTTSPPTSPMGGGIFDYVVTWTNVPATGGYSLTYTPGTTSSSQAAARVDTLSAVPEPASMAVVAGVTGALLRRRRAASL